MCKKRTSKKRKRKKIVRYMELLCYYYIYTTLPRFGKLNLFASPRACFRFAVQVSGFLVGLLSAVYCLLSGSDRIFQDCTRCSAACIVIRLCSGPVLSGLICVLSGIWSGLWSVPGLVWSVYSNCAALLATLAACYTHLYYYISYKIYTR